MVEVLRLAGADACLAGPAYPGAAGVGRLQALFLEDFEDALVAFDAQAQALRRNSRRKASVPPDEDAGATGASKRSKCRRSAQPLPASRMACINPSGPQQ